MTAEQQTQAGKTIGERGGRVPVIGIGGSAGALDALKEFFEAMPADLGAAVVVIQHLAPQQESNMAEILANHTAMTVEQAADAINVKHDHVYVIPPGVFLQITDGTVHLSKATPTRGARMPIDLFFRSLAEDLAQQAVCIVLSGTGTDGTLGLRAVKEKGGLAIVQDPEEAPYDGMPRSAIGTAAVDLVLRVREMPKAIRTYFQQPYVNFQQPYVNGKATAHPEGERLEDALDSLIELLASKTSHHFGSYKSGTLLRRTERRMAVRQIRSAKDYLRLLQTDEQEVELLAKDLLINVTNFFRDHDAFDFLAENVLPDLLSSEKNDGNVRIWVPGCSTGEEAYSIAMLAREQLEKHNIKRKMIVFASDIDEDALAFARTGLYSDSIETDVSPERLDRFFVKDEHAYRVSSDLRESVVFALQNLLTDAPFSKLDLISCRNVLIYLRSTIQEQLLELFHFALQGSGVLFLGPSETVAPKRDHFEEVSHKHHIFRCIGPARKNRVQFPIVSAEKHPPLVPRMPGTAAPKKRGLFDTARGILLTTAAPASVVVNRRYEALCFFGPIDRYLRVTVGEMPQNVLTMAMEGLRFKLRMTIKSALDQNAPSKDEGAIVTQNGETARIAMEAHPFQWDSEWLVLVSFKDQPPTTGERRAGDEAATSETPANEQLERELEATRNELQEAIRELETANEELRAGNEEALSMNEEFQSTNEELETSKEELQSVNEELTTLNNQLQQKAEQHRQAANDLNNVLVSADIPTIFLDTDLKIRMFTPAAKRLFSIIASDMDRPLADLAKKFEDPHLVDRVKSVLDQGTPVASEVKCEDGSWFSRRIRPYRTEDSNVEGVVLTFHDISDLMSARLEAEGKRDVLRRLAAVVESSEDAIILQDDRGVITAWNPGAEKIYGYSAEEALGKKCEFLANSDHKGEPFELLRQVLQGHAIRDHRTTRRSKGGKEIRVSVSCSPVRDESGEIVSVSTIERDISGNEESREALESKDRRLREQFEELETLYRTAPVGLALMDRDLRYLRINETLAEINGRPVEEHLGQTIGDVLPDIAKDVAPKLRTVFETGNDLRNIEISGETAADPGMHHHWREDVYPVKGTDGDVIAVGVIVKDITEEKRAEEELNKAKVEAERANRVKSDFLAAASHDIRQPLQTLSLLQEVLERKVKDEELMRVVATLGATIGGMKETLNTLLDIDQLESGVIEPQIEVFAIGDHLRRLEDEYIHPARAKGLEFHVVATTACIRTDPHLVIRALQNLVANAIKYTSAGKVLLGCRRHGAFLRIEVWDSGIGIPADQLHAVFDRYHRADTAAPFQRHGLGLGLSVVRHMMELLGHEFEVRSIVGKGTMLAIVIPLADTQKPVKAVSSRKIRARSVLIVEEDQALRESLETLLQLENFEVAAVGSGEQALARVSGATTLPDAVVTDSDLGAEVDGIELVRKLRQKSGRHIPAVVMTGRADRHMLEQIGAAAMTALQKPVKSESLIELLRELPVGEDGSLPMAKPGRTDAIIDLPRERSPDGEFASQAPTDSMVFLVDDDEAARATWRSFLEAEGFTVQAFASGEAFLEFYKPGLHGCLVTDIVLPGMSGLELQSRLLDAGATIPVIVATGRRELRIAAQAVLAGAVDVMEKPVPSKKLVDAVRRALHVEKERELEDVRNGGSEGSGMPI